MVLDQDRHVYVKAVYGPQVRLSVHAMARFMYRAKSPPQVLIERLARLASFARLFSDTATSEGSVALAVPEGLIHGRIGVLSEKDEFRWQCRVAYNFDPTGMSSHSQPDCAHGKPNAIDLITFLPLAELNPHLSALHAALTTLQETCRRGAEIAYAIAFHGHRPDAEDLASLAQARRAVLDHLGSDLHAVYRMKQDDREIAALIAQINREADCVPDETAMLAALTAARMAASRPRADGVASAKA